MNTCEIMWNSIAFDGKLNRRGVLHEHELAIAKNVDVCFVPLPLPIPPHPCPLPWQVAFFLPQLVQLLRSDKTGQIEAFLLAAAARSRLFAHHLVCFLRSEATPPEEAFNPAVKRSNWEPPVDTGLWQIGDRCDAWSGLAVVALCCVKPAGVVIG